MPNHIDAEPIQTEITVESFIGTDSNLRVRFNSAKQLSWAQWFGQVRNALFRPTVTVSASFGSTTSGQYTAFTVNFPTGSLRLGIDCLALASPMPPNGTAFTVHCSANDQAKILFHNYSGGPLSFSAANFTVTVLTN